MSNLRERAREIKAAGEQSRGEFTPSGIPLNVYQYWAKHSNAAPERENFCHFWRVVAIWAPLMFAKRAATRVIEHPATVITLIAAVVIGTIWIGVAYGNVGAIMLLVLAGVVAFALLIAGLLGGAALAVKGDDMRRKYDLPTFRPALALSLMGLPAAALSFGIGKVVQFYNRRLSQWDKEIGLGAIVLGLLVFFSMIAWTEGVGDLLLLLGGLVVAMVVIGMCIIGFSALGDWIGAKRKATKIRVEREWGEYYDEHGYYPGAGPSRPRKPSKVGAFFKGVGDFLILLGQVVRVNKWKICPTVDIPKDANA